MFNDESLVSTCRKFGVRPSEPLERVRVTVTMMGVERRKVRRVEDARGQGRKEMTTEM